jgi:hypothetical protein
LHVALLNAGRMAESALVSNCRGALRHYHKILDGIGTETKT